MWDYDFFKDYSVTNKDNGLIFNASKVDELTLTVDLVENPNELSESEVKKNKKELLDVINDEHLSNILYGLVNNDLGQEQLQAARIIEKETGRSCSQRTLQSWMIDRNYKSKRKCPKEVVVALKHYINSNDEEMKRHKKFIEHREQSAEYITQRRRENSILSSASDKIKSEESRKKYWRSKSISELADAIYEMEENLRGYCYYHNRQLANINLALESAESFSEFKKACLSKNKEADYYENYVYRTVNDIKSNNEFD